MSHVGRIVLHIPHSSSAFPVPEDRKAWPDGIDYYINRWTDWFTDIIFTTGNPRVTSVLFPYSRFYCDVERLVDDPLNAIGQGIVYNSFEDLERTTFNRGEVMKSYEKHIGRLCSAIEGDDTLLIDCHSFPADLSDVDVCIGINDDWSRPPELMLDLVLALFRWRGYSTEINSPYSNSISPKTGFPYSSFMIEVNKRIYLSDTGRPMEEGLLHLKETVGLLYEVLLSPLPFVR